MRSAASGPVYVITLRRYAPVSLMMYDPGSVGASVIGATGIMPAGNSPLTRGPNLAGAGGGCVVGEYPLYRFMSLP